MERPRKQEQEPAAPDVTEVGPDVLRIQLPVQMPGLGHVNMYVLVDQRGAAVVDPGLPGPLSWKALQKRLPQAGVKLRQVHTVIVTHSHPDHYGQAARLAKEAGAAEIVTHAAFRSWRPGHGHSHSHDDDGADFSDLPDDHQPEPFPTEMPGVNPWGGAANFGPPTRREGFRMPVRRRLQMRLMRSRMVQRFGPPAPSVRLRHGDVIKLAGREWFAVHTPGHTLDHLCLHDPEAGILLSGDHVLPTITPHISGLYAGKDPLALFFDSLDRVANLDPVTRVLPAHGHPFDDLVARTDAIKEHHQERLAKLREVAPGMGAGTVEEFSHHLFRPERWGSMAESETYAHLEHLRSLGLAERRDRGDGVLVYELEPLPAS